MSEIRKLPAQEPRVESGPVQFGDDWPGIFLRGDTAGWYAMQLKSLLDEVVIADTIQDQLLRSLQSDLASCVVGPVRELVQPK